MAFSTKELKDKSEPELAAIAEELGLQLNAESTGKNTFIMEIIQAQEEDAAAQADEPPEEVVNLTKPTANTRERKEKKVRLIVSNQEGVEQTPFVKVQVNGYMYVLPRETEVVVPESVVGVLKNAVVTRLVQSNGDWIEQTARRFPYTVLGPAK